MRRVNKDQRVRISLTLNGRKASAEPEPRTLLSDFLRHSLGATGTHVGCEHGVCGCCTVQIDGAAVRSWLTLAMQAEGRDVKTVESLAGESGKLNKLQMIRRPPRSKERRVGKECRSRWSPYHLIRRAPRSTLFPCTTLLRSLRRAG